MSPMHLRYITKLVAVILISLLTLGIGATAFAAEITVKSEFGATHIQPPLGTITVPIGSTISFKAPRYIYLNRFFEELDEIGDVDDPDESKVAYYRARNMGYSIDGNTIQGAEFTFQHTVEKAKELTVIWEWELQYAVFIDNETAGQEGAVSSVGNTTGGSEPGDARRFYSNDTEFSTSIKRVVNVGSSVNPGRRLEVGAYKLENVKAIDQSVADEYFMQVSNTQPTPSQGFKFERTLDLEPSEGMTVAFWGKIDRTSPTNDDQVMLYLYKGGATIANGEFGVQNVFESMSFGVRADGRFYVEEATYKGQETEIENKEAIIRELVSVPAALVGLNWHHWAVSFDFSLFDLTGYEMEIMVVDDLDDLIKEGQELVVLAQVGNVLHIRIFDELGGIIIDEPIDDSAQNSESERSEDFLRHLIEGSYILGFPLGRIPISEYIHVVNETSGVFQGWGWLTDNLDSTSILTSAIQSAFPSAPSSKREISVYRDGLKVFHDTLPVPLGNGNPPPPVPPTDVSYQPGVLDGIYRVLAIGEAWSNDWFRQFHRIGLEGGVFAPSLWDHVITQDEVKEHAQGVREGNVFSVSFDSTNIDSVKQFPSKARNVLRSDRTVPVPESVGTDAATERIVINDWLRIKWIWNEQVRYRFGAPNPAIFSGWEAFAEPYLPSPGLAEQAFIVVHDSDHPDDPLDPDRRETTIPAGIITDLWIDVGKKVDVGSFYRTLDRCYTLTDFVTAPSGDLRSFGRDISSFRDHKYQERQARVVTISEAKDPSEIYWHYQPTIFRAVIPLGQAFDPNGLDLVPKLCEGAVLRGGKKGPGNVFTFVGKDSPAGTSDGDVGRWDQLGQLLYPVHPQSFRVDWPDANVDGKTHKIEIVTGFPGDGVNLTSERENMDGSRIDPPNYQWSTTMTDVSSDFPGAPKAHYRHLFDSKEERRPPTKLDISSSDRWFFKGLTFFESQTSASVGTEPGSEFNASGKGRSILLYQYRSNPDEIANGDEINENLAVRIVESDEINIVDSNETKEVATRITSSLDTANFHTGYILNKISNYNPRIYDRGAEIGEWGPIYPVNDDMASPTGTELQVAYYENPFLNDPNSNTILHPNVAWPYTAVEYADVNFPESGPHKDKRIYIASRVGTEGVDKEGKLQTVYHLDSFANLEIYNQDDPKAAGYNPNEEHALVVNSNRGALRIREFGEELSNIPPLAAFALQDEINVVEAAGYTSDPWVLIQVENLDTGEPEMAAYKVERERSGTISFPRPTDADVSSKPYLEYEIAENPDDRFLLVDSSKIVDFEYKFDYPVYAGDLLIPPYPLNLVIGNVVSIYDRGMNIQV
ncbi:hypothetical protein OAM01_02255, partial [bacterium]|nr:hypothetical protein [bacterium]